MEECRKSEFGILMKIHKYKVYRLKQYSLTRIIKNFFRRQNDHVIYNSLHIYKNIYKAQLTVCIFDKE